MDLQTMENEWQDLKRENAALKAELRAMSEKFEAKVDLCNEFDIENHNLKAELAAVRELMNNYNLGGWTDALGPMQRALQAEAELAAAHRAGMLAAADLLQQQWYKTQDECERVIREAAEK